MDDDIIIFLDGFDTEINQPLEKVITEFRKNELQFYACGMYLISNLRYIIEIMLTISQIDIAIYSVIVSELAGIFTIRLLLNEKLFFTANASLK